MRVYRGPKAVSGAVRKAAVRHKAASAALAGTLAVLPAVAATGGAASWVNLASVQNINDAPGSSDVLALQGGYDTGLTPVAVNGSLPDAAQPQTLPAYELPEPSTGPLGIPGSALKAYRNAAERMAAEQPGCGIDWALIASIGRIESNHARGGYVDAQGTTREPILGPVLNGIGPVAAIRDTDGGRHDGDTVWDRAVGPTQFIPSTWVHYAADGTDDGAADPNNIYDAALASARYLCSGGFDLTDPEQLRAAIYRYNHSDTYVNTVILWAKAYREGVTPTPDSTVPTGTTSNATTTGAPEPTAPPVAGSTSPAPSPTGQPRADMPSSEPGTKLPPEVIAPSEDGSEPEPPPSSTKDPDPSTTPPSDDETDTPPPSTDDPAKTCEPVPVEEETGEPETDSSTDQSGEESGDELPPCDEDSDGDGMTDKLREQPSGTEENRDDTGNTDDTEATETATPTT
ncbi:lytic transglycosylase domain-containing protein [Amycolatopsis palatopharyngis]|uniref:lytic transglycosylase domain-containing protein n=1 Tax=Amycolatopsis palatopharyngis TaxID=187982 RepID=UPI000E27EFA8|nr:lytic murein transglycosylase [Amycolatopsis palatopharyngis]